MANRVTKFLWVYRVVQERGKDEPISKRKVNNSPNSGWELFELAVIVPGAWMR